MKRKSLLLLLTVVFALFTLTILSSCSIFGPSETVVPPTIDSVEMLKDEPNYTESREYLYNKDTENPMAIFAGKSFLVSIKYNNPKKYAISYVTVNNEKVMPSQFAAGSSKTNTIIKITVPANATKGDEMTFNIKNIFYNTGSETKKMKFGEDLDMNFTVKVSPSYYLTLNYQNADRRASSAQPKDEESNPSSIDYGSEMNVGGILDADYTNDTVGLPTKAGGWIFEGWYTEPNGKGQLVKSTDTYYFWSDVTLYAHYTRLFEYEIVSLDKPITNVVNDKTITYNSGAIITKDNSRGKYPIMNIDDTIVDEKIVTNETTGKETVTSAEYPVVKIANKAFKDVNNIKELTIGKFVKEIGAYAFDNCNALEKAAFNKGSSLKVIGDYAFQGTKKMGITSSFTLPDAVTYLGNFAFRYSGWKITTNNGINESVLHVKPTYKFIGAACFFQTGFSQVVFDAGCKFDTQIGSDEAKEIEKNAGWNEAKTELNRIGANLFGNCANLIEVKFLSDDGENNALNIVPDACFDAGNYTVNCIETLTLAEGIEYIGNNAFNYQAKITRLEIPATVTEIGKSAFYNCSNATSLTFKEGSMLRILHSRCFGNMKAIDRVVIVSTDFEKYGNGPFEGCSRLKSIEFPNLNVVDKIPKGFSRAENKDEVLPQHKFSDLLYGTFESGSNDSGDGTISTYSLPTRIFCKDTVMESFKQTILDSKATYTFNSNGETTATIAPASTFRNVVFVHNIGLIKTYVNPGATQGEESEVSIALQPIYNINDKGKDERNKTPIAYSIVYWSVRSKNIVLPDKIDGLTKPAPITELAMYALPTSVTTLTVPANITRFEHDALNGCVNLEEVKFLDKNTFEYIGDYAFFGTKITSFEGGTSLRVIGQNAFMRCRSLKWIDLSETAIVNETTPSGNNNRKGYLTQFKYEYEVEKGTETDYRNALGDGAFQGCTSLEWAYLPKKLQQLGTATFTACKQLRTLIIESVIKSTANTQLDNEAFYYRSLPTAIFEKETANLMTIYVPSSQESAHKIIFKTPKYALIAAGNVPSHP